MPSIEQLQAALEHVEGATPQEVLDAFLPKKKEIAGFPLVPLTMGHSLFLSHCQHPLSKGKLEGWEAHDVGLALFAFTHKSDDLKRQVEEGTLESSLYQFMDRIDLADVPKYTALLMAHYLNSIQTGIEMHDPNAKSAQKKTLLGGFFQRLRGYVASIIGSLILSFIPSRSVKP